MCYIVVQRCFIQCLRMSNVHSVSSFRIVSQNEQVFSQSKNTSRVAGISLVVLSLYTTWSIFFIRSNLYSSTGLQYGYFVYIGDRYVQGEESQDLMWDSLPTYSPVRPVVWARHEARREEGGLPSRSVLKVLGTLPA